MFYVYILYSANHDSFYIGYSSDLEKRLSDHNAGLTQSTKGKRPWTIIYIESLASKTLALKRERFLKKQKNKAFYKKLAGLM